MVGQNGVTPQQFTTMSNYIITPILSIVGEPSNVLETPILTGSAFNPTTTDTHISSDWQIFQNQSLIYESINNTVNLTTFTVPNNYLLPNTEYVFKLRYKGLNLGYSQYVSKTITTETTFRLPAKCALGLKVSPYLIIYDIDVESFTKRSNLLSMPTSLVDCIKFSNNGEYMALVTQYTPFVMLYRIVDNIFNLLSLPTTNITGVGAGGGYNYSGIAWSSDDKYVAFLGTLGSPHPLSIYKVEGNNVTKMVLNTLTIPNMYGTGISWSGDNYICLTFQPQPYVSTCYWVFKITGETETDLTLTNLTVPSIGETTASLNCCFDKNNRLYISSYSSPSIDVLEHSGDVFSKLTGPTPPGLLPWNCKVSHNNYYLCCSGDGTYGCWVYNTTTLAKIFDYGYSADQRLSCSWSHDDKLLGINLVTPPYIKLWRNTSGVFTELSAPVDTPNAVSIAIDFA